MNNPAAITAINPIYRKHINRFVKWDTRYNAIVDATEDNGGKAQEDAYEKACDAWFLLPKRERANIAKNYNVEGY